MEQSTSEANRFSASQDDFPIIWIPNVRCLVYQSPTPVLILRQINPVHVPPSPLLGDLSSHNTWAFQVVSFPQVSLPNPVCSPVRDTCPTYLILLYVITGIIFGEKCRHTATTKLLKQSACAPSYPSSLIHVQISLN